MPTAAFTTQSVFSTNTLLKNNKAADATEDLLRLPPVLTKYRNSHSASECPPERQQAIIRAPRRNDGEMKGRSVSIFPSLLQHGLNQMILQLCGWILTGTRQHQDLHVAITFLSWSKIAAVKENFSPHCVLHYMFGRDEATYDIWKPAI